MGRSRPRRALAARSSRPSVPARPHLSTLAPAQGFWRRHAFRQEPARSASPQRIVACGRSRGDAGLASPSRPTGRAFRPAGSLGLAPESARRRVARTVRRPMQAPGPAGLTVLLEARPAGHVPGGGALAAPALKAAHASGEPGGIGLPSSARARHGAARLKAAESEQVDPDPRGRPARADVREKKGGRAFSGACPQAICAASRLLLSRPIPRPIRQIGLPASPHRSRRPARSAGKKKARGGRQPAVLHSARTLRRMASSAASGEPYVTAMSSSPGTYSP